MPASSLSGLRGEGDPMRIESQMELYVGVEIQRSWPRYPSWPGVDDSTEGRIPWRRPTAIVRFSLANLRRNMHSDKSSCAPRARPSLKMDNAP